MEKYKYTIGQIVNTVYTNPPVEEDKRCSIGEIVDIMDSKTKKVLARFRVDETDNVFIKGTVVEVF
jgi:hypothetical protein